MTTPAPVKAQAQAWNAANYASRGRFVADLATGVVDLLAPRPGDHILDVGCGDGALTAQLAATGAHVTGIDSSASMIEAARARHPDVHLCPIADLPRHPTLGPRRFDAAFSNAALHWIPRPAQPAALTALHGALRPGARFVAEMGGQGNIAAIRTALAAVLGPHGLDSETLAASFFPSPEQYAALLAAAGFRVLSMALIPRPTPLPGAAEGLRLWLETFRNGVLDHLPADARASALDDVVRLLRPILFDSGDTTRPPLWTADYVRLRFHAIRQP